MDNILTYMKFRADVTFRQAPFNEADAMVLSAIIGLDFEGLSGETISMYELAERYSDIPNPETKDERYDEKEHLLFMAGHSARFGDVSVSNYVKDINYEEEKTFYGMTFRIGPSHKVIVFRGTDGSLLSWKENFDCLYKFPSPGQLQAKRYVEERIKETKNPFVKFYVAGHSKGGNLACYGSIFADPKLQKRIEGAYLFDAPGFIENLSEEPAFLRIRDRMHFYVPESCVIGRLMTGVGDLIPVKAEGKGIYQHDMFWWRAEGTGLEKAEALNEFSNRLSRKVNGWIDSQPLEERKATVDELFGVFENNGIMHISDLMHIEVKKLLGMIMSATRLSHENRRLLGIIFRELWS